MSRKTPVTFSDSDVLFLHSTPYSCNLVRLDGREFKPVPQWSWQWHLGRVNCTSDGFLLLSDKLHSYTICRPLTNFRSVSVRCPYSFLFPTRQAICYDPVDDDVKLIVVAWAHYTVYSSKNNSWTNNGKRVPRCFQQRIENESPVSADGAVYWAENYSREIVFFDPSRNEFKNLPLPESYVEGLFQLVCLGGVLCLWARLERGVRFWMKGKGKDVNSWEEMMTIENVEMMRRARKKFEPLCLVEDDKIAIRLDNGVIAIYNPSEDTFEAKLAIDSLNKFDERILTKDSLKKFDERNGLVPYAVKGCLNERNGLLPFKGCLNEIINAAKDSLKKFDERNGLVPFKGCLNENNAALVPNVLGMLAKSIESVHMRIRNSNFTRRLENFLQVHKDYEL